jgi:hypothetical protein
VSKIIWLISFMVVCLTPAAQARAASFEVQGEEISLPAQGWYLNITGARVQELADHSAENNNRISHIRGYYVEGVGVRFILRVVDQPSRNLSLLIGDRPNWARWRLDHGLTRQQLRARIDDYYHRQNFEGFFDSYSTPNGVRYAAIFTLFRRNENDPPAGRQYDLAIPHSQWQSLLQNRLRAGFHPFNVTTAINRGGEVEFSAIFNTPDNFETRILQSPAIYQRGREAEQHEQRARQQGMEAHDIDVAAGRDGDQSRFSVLWYNTTGHTWRFGRNWRYFGFGNDRLPTSRTLLLDVPRSQLNQRLDQIADAGRYLMSASAAQRYHGGGAGNDVVFALLVSGDEALPDLPAEPEVDFARMTMPPFALNNQISSALSLPLNQRSTTEILLIRIRNVEENGPVYITQSPTAEGVQSSPAGAVHISGNGDQVYVMDATHLGTNYIQVRYRGDDEEGSSTGELIGTYPSRRAAPTIPNNPKSEPPG